MRLYNIIVVAILYQSTANGSSSSLDDCSRSECETGKFCAGEDKLCVDHTKCLKDADCNNSLNQWMQPMCIGRVKCMASDIEGEPGDCGKFCDIYCETDRDCDDGQQYCAGGVCLDHATCRGDKDCLHPSNMWTEPECMGSITCEDDSCTKNCEDWCKSDNQCGEQQYCADGLCLNYGHCRHENDCRHESNMWYQPMCEGPIKCNDRLCGIACETLCESDKDCYEQQYCGAGVCREHKTCEKDADCRNPSNPWAQPKCIGFNKCNGGVCGRTCGYHCEDKSDPVQCFVEPCEANDYDDGFTCVNDYCGGCNTIVFDAAGNEVFPLEPTDTSDYHTPFPLSDECIERCPDVIDDWRNSKCDSTKLEGCACPYKSDKFCALECHYPSTNWSLKCLRGRPLNGDDNSDNAPSITDSSKAPFSHYTPFETPSECVEVCSEVDIKFQERCDLKKMGTCRCVSEDDPYCFHTCIDNGVGGLWAMACQDVLPPPPPDDKTESSDTPTFDPSPSPTLETKTPAPTQADRVGKKQKKQTKESNKVPKKGEKVKKDEKQTK